VCHEYHALPPTIPDGVLARLALSSGQPVPSGEHITLISEDGSQFAAYRARPANPSGAGIVILPDVRGLFRFYEDLAERFAQAGVDALSIDYFGRTVGTAPRDETFDFMAHVMQTKPEQLSQDVGAAVARLRQISPNTTAIFTVGFCFGGANSLQQAANGHGLAGVIAFYGSPTSSRRGTPPIDRISQFTCPVLGFYGGQDQGIPVSDVQQFDAALTEAKLPHELVVYPDAPHSFFDRTYDQYQQECADAWQRMLAFLSTNTAQQRI
jgi:carboxymethylenebutenolidase